jgi:hypothetical protein
MRLAVALAAAFLLAPDAGPISAQAAPSLHAAKTADVSAAKKQLKAAKKSTKKPRAKTEQYMRAVPTK